MKTARAELLDANGYVITFDDQWKVQGNELSFTGGDRPVLLPSIVSQLRIHIDQYHWDFEPGARLLGIAVTRGMVINLSDVIVRLFAPWDTILGLGKEEEMPSWGVTK